MEGPKERGGEGEGEESGGDIAEMRWRMKGGKGGEEGKGMDDRPTKEGERTHQRGRWEIFNTHFAKTILLRRRRIDETAAMAANGMAFISRQFADPSPHSLRLSG